MVFESIKRSKIFHLFLLTLIGTLLTAQPLCAQETKQRFTEAQKVFTQGLAQTGEAKRLTMLKAAGLFQSLIKEHKIENGYLYYNIGNSFYEAGEKGKAILYYRKAERLIPGNQDLLYNLSMVREELNLPKEKQQWWSDLLEGAIFWHYTLPISTRSTLFIIAFILFWVLLTVAIFYRNIFLLVGQILLLVTMVPLGSSWAVSAWQIYWTQSGVIIEKEAFVRKGPGNSYEPFFDKPLPAGTEFRVLEQQGEWWKVRLKTGEELWLKKSSTEII